MAPGVKTGINIKYENPRELGSDRIANAVAAYDEYGGPCIFIDFGTATTFGVVDQEGSFLGGTICPGIKLSSEALVTGTAKLPRFELNRPENVIGRSTLTNLQSGMYYGYVGLVRNIVRKIRQELGEDAYVVATGGMALMIAEESNVIDKLDGLLTLKGLRLIYERNRTETESDGRGTAWTGKHRRRRMGPDPGIRRGSQQAYGREARGEEGSRAGQENPQGQGSTG